MSVSTPNLRQGDPEIARSAAAERLRRLSLAARALIAALPTVPSSAAELARELGTLKKNGWQLFRLAEVDDPFDAVRFVPGRKPLEDMAEAARHRGADDAAVDELIAAMDDLERLRREMASDRTTFISMLQANATSASAGAEADRQHRMAAFKSFVHFCGMHVDLSQDIDFVHYDDEDTRRHVAVRTVRGLQRLRPDAACVVDSHRVHVDDPNAPVASGPLDQRAFREHGVPVLPQFCSRPLPELVLNYEGEKGDQVFVEWAGKKVGMAGAVDVCTGLLTTVAADATKESMPRVRSATQVGYPARRLTRAWLLRVPHTEMLPPVLRGYLEPSAFDSDVDRRRATPMYVNESIRYHPPGSWRGLPDGHGLDREQITHVCATMNWDPSDFAIYTLEVDYPLMHSVLSIELGWK